MIHQRFNKNQVNTNIIANEKKLKPLLSIQFFFMCLTPWKIIDIDTIQWVLAKF